MNNTQKAQIRYVCPIVNTETVIPCAVHSCMYHDPSSAKGCGHARLIATTQKEGVSKEAKKRAVCEFFSLEEEDLAISIRRVISVLCVSEFFKHVYDKSIMDARPKELEALGEYEARYNAWRVNSKKIEFQEFLKTLVFLKNNLR